MSINNRTISCIGCNQPYNNADHQPQVLDCGHGSCKSCVDQMTAQAVAASTTPVCQKCHHIVQTPIPNFELLEHSDKFSEVVVKTIKQYQDLAKSLDEQISKVDGQLNILKDKIVGEIASEIVDESKDLQPKAQELVKLGVYDDLEQAKTALLKAISRSTVIPLQQLSLDLQETEKAIVELKDLVLKRSKCLSKLFALKEDKRELHEELQEIKDTLGKKASGLKQATGLYRERDLLQKQLSDNNHFDDKREKVRQKFLEIRRSIRFLKEKRGSSLEFLSETERDERKQTRELAKIEARYAQLIKQYFDIDGVDKHARSDKIKEKNAVQMIAIAGTVAKQCKDGRLIFHPFPDIDNHGLHIPDPNRANKLVFCLTYDTTIPAPLPIHITDNIYSCGICTDSYAKSGARQPFVFSCGHGSCVTCVEQMQKHAMESCHTCRQPINSTVINKDLIDQMSLDTKELSERFIPHQDIIKFKHTCLRVSKEKFNALNNIMGARFQERSKTNISNPSSSSSSTSSSSESVLCCDEERDEEYFRRKVSEMKEFAQLAEEYAKIELEIENTRSDTIPIAVKIRKKRCEIKYNLSVYVVNEVKKQDSNEDLVIEAAIYILEQAIFKVAGLSKDHFDKAVMERANHVCDTMKRDFNFAIDRAFSDSSSFSSLISITSPFQGFVDVMEGMRDSFSNWWNQTVVSNQPQSHTTTTASTTYLPSSAQTAPPVPTLPNSSSSTSTSTTTSTPSSTSTTTATSTSNESEGMSRRRAALQMKIQMKINQL